MVRWGVKALRHDAGQSGHLRAREVTMSMTWELGSRSSRKKLLGAVLVGLVAVGACFWAGRKLLSSAAADQLSARLARQTQEELQNFQRKPGDRSTLIDAYSDGILATYVYKLDADAKLYALPIIFIPLKAITIARACDVRGFQSFIDLGAVYRFKLIGNDDEPIGSVEVTKAICAQQPPST